MAIQVINDPYRSFTGASIGQAVGSGLGASLAYLASKKLSQLEERQHRADQLQMFQQAGYSPEQAQLLSNYASHPAEQLKLAQMLGQIAPQQQQEQPTFFQQQPSIQEYQEPMAQLQQRQTPQWMQGLQGLSQGPQDQGIQAQQSLSQRLGLPELPSSQFGRQLAEAIQKGQLQPELVQQQARPMAQPMMAQPQQQQMQPVVQPQPKKTVAQTLGSYETPQQKLAREKMEQRERHFQKQREDEERKLRLTETKAERQAIHEKAKAAKQNLRDLDRLEELQAEGKLDTPGYVEFLKRSGLDIPALMNEGSQEFNKVVQNFMRDAKTYLGSRISNFELEQFLRTLPNLSQSNAGRQRVIANLKQLNRAALAYNETMKEVMADYKGIPPLDLADQVEDKVDKKLDRIAEQFRKDVSKPVPREQPRLRTALQSIAGSILGAPGALVGAAAKAAPALSALV